MRWSQALIPTLKETPADAVAPSHVLLLRAGMIRQLGRGGVHLPAAGLPRAATRPSRIVREEMDAAGALELLMPALQPVELWQESGRYGDIRRHPDGAHPRRRPRRSSLGPTHEEVVTDLVRDLVKSYKQLPDHPLPDPDQVPRRAPAPVRHPADPRVPDEGRLQLRRRRRPAQRQLRRDVRGLLPDLRPLRPPLRRRRGRERPDRRRQLARVHGPLVDRRGRGHPVPDVRLRGQPRAGRDRRRPGRARARPGGPALRDGRDAQPADDPGGLRLPQGPTSRRRPSSWSSSPTASRSPP